MKTLPTAWLLLLGALTAVGPLSIDMYLPAFPAVEADLGARPGAVEFSLASFFIGMAVGQLFYGPVSDRFGRRPPLMVGLALFSAASLACALSGNVAALTAWRLLQALGGCAGLVIARAIVRDRCAARDAARAFSLLILVFGLAPILAPLMGSWVATHLGWRAIFGLLALYGALCLLAVHRLLPETHDMSKRDGVHGDARPGPPLRLGRVLGDYGRLLMSRSLVGYSLVSGLAFAGMFAYIAGSPFVLIQLHGISPQHFGWIFGLNALGFVVLSQVNARLLNTTPLTRLLHRAVWVPAIAGISLVLLGQAGWLPLPLLLAGFFCYVASLGFIGPNATAAALATHGQRAGSASALMGALQFSLATLAGSLVGLWHDGTEKPLLVIMGLCGLGAWLAHRWLAAPLDAHARAGR